MIPASIRNIIITSALLGIISSIKAHAAYISAGATPIPNYQGTLYDGLTVFGQIYPDNSDGFWRFLGNAGDIITLTVNRLEATFDPALDVYFGTGSHTNALPHLLRADDNILELPGYEGPWEDPQVSNYSLLQSGYYTVHVWSYLSGDAGEDGVYDYQITLIGSGHRDDRTDIPIPAGMAILGVGLLGLGIARRRK